MAKKISLDDLSFAKIPQDAVLEDAEALRLIVAAHGGLQGVYGHLAGAVDGERLFLLDLLRKDWAKHAEAYMEPARKCLAELSGKDDGEVKPRPTDGDARDLAERLKALRTPELISGLESVVERCAVCLQLVPLGSVSPRVRALFRQAVEAEDLHLAQVHWLREILAGV